MRYAIVTSGGKQYVAREGETLEVDRLDPSGGEIFEFSDVLLAAEDEQVLVGAPVVKGAKVRAKIVGEVKAKKVVVFRYQPKKRRRRKLGHRQTYSRLVIEEIDLPGVARKQKAEGAGEKPAPRKKPASAPKKAAGKSAKTSGRTAKSDSKGGGRPAKKKGS